MAIRLVAVSFLLVAPPISANPSPYPAVGTGPDAPVVHDSSTPPGFWTKERISKAVPYPHPSIKRGGPHTHTPLNTSVSCNAPQAETGYDSFPAKAIGRLLFTQDNDEYICSASFVGSFKVALTAGHCCYDSGMWAGNWVLTLDYPTKSTQYKVKNAWVTTGWKEGDYMYDFCWLEMEDEGPAYLGYQENPDTSSLNGVAAYGYPENYGSNEQMYRATGNFETKRKAGSGYVGSWQMSCNPCHSGNSGGPWVVASGHVVGLNSYHDGGDASWEEWSPWFGETMYKICQSAGGCNALFRDSASAVQGNNTVIV